MTSTNDSERLERLGERFWDTAMEASPLWASLLGDHRFDDSIEDYSREREDALIESFTGIVSEAEALDPAGLDETERTSRRVLMFEAESIAGSLRSRTAEFKVDPKSGPHLDIIQGVPQLRAATDDQADAFVVKASKVGRMFDQAIDRLRDGIDNGRTPPRVAAEKVIGQLDAYAALDLADHPLLQIRLPDEWSDDRRSRWAEAMQEQIRDVVDPAFARYRDAIASEVLPVARPPERSGVCWLPDGDEIYRRAVRRYTSLDLDPDDLHRIGLDEIASLEDEYRAVGSVALDTKDVTDIYERLRSDPSLRFETPDQIRSAAEEALDRANAAIGDWFGRLPEAPCIVEPIPPIGAEDSTIAYYFPPAADGSRPGVYFVNLSEPTTRTRYEAEALAFHESVPGHHLQLAIAQELEGLPTFRRNATVTVYVEGWGLYTERLADDMGLYSDDLSRLGMLSFDSWRACRLVVDTGLHAKGWSRQQAIDYMAANSPQAMNNIVNEVDRYIGYTAQALAYKTGQRELFRLRDLARDSLGAAFAIADFHDVVLGAGALPLEVLATRVEAWIGSIRGEH